MGTILVTGGAGYVGSHTVKRLRDEGIDCIVLDNLTRGHRELVKDARLVEGDLGDAPLLKSIFKENDIRAVMHFSAFAYVEESVSDPAKYYRNNVSSTVTLLSCMLEAGLSSLIFSSTCATYGVPLRIPITEDHPQNPINPYGATKAMVERILKDFNSAYGLSYVSFRYFNAAGADPEGEIGEWHEPETHLIPSVLETACGLRDSVRVYGADYPTQDGTCVRDYIHVCDLADAHILGLKYLLGGGSSDFFNLGNGNGFSVKEVIEMASRVTGSTVPTVYAPRRPGDPPVLVGSSEKAKKILNWKPKFSQLDQILSTAWIWQQKLNARRQQAK
ncbi:MAG: UDP-glucose 4-epimerase GalE [Acidobacteria bacterium]|nr:UDP-glucose 4-epimerase GalE [Acidobacteriota bacterium]MCI0718277.1 UDP-glucose 4-epimerase GalE [Acidobacteriota bacterium]